MHTSQQELLLGRIGLYQFHPGLVGAGASGGRPRGRAFSSPAVSTLSPPPVTEEGPRRFAAVVVAPRRTAASSSPRPPPSPPRLRCRRRPPSCRRGGEKVVPVPPWAGARGNPGAGCLEQEREAIPLSRLWKQATTRPRPPEWSTDSAADRHGRILSAMSSSVSSNMSAAWFERFNFLLLYFLLSKVLKTVLRRVLNHAPRC